MKKCFLVVLALICTSTVFAVNITTNDGQKILNAKVFDIRVNGIVVSYVDGDDFDTLKFINFKNLPKDLQEKYHYNTEAANTFDQKHDAWLNEQAEKQELSKELNNKLADIQQNLEQEIQDKSINIQFESRNTVNKGTEGRYWQLYPNGKQVYKGEMLLLGEEFGDKGSMWSGDVYPMNESQAYNGEDLQTYAEVNFAFQILYNREKQKLINSMKQQETKPNVQ